MFTLQQTSVLACQTDSELIEQMRQCIEVVAETRCGFFLLISGYDFDEREVFEIPEVVDLCQRLCKIGFPSVLWPSTWLKESGDIGGIPRKDAAELGMGAFEVWAIAVGLIAERRSPMYFPQTVVLRFFEKELPQMHKRCDENLEAPPD